MRALITQYGVLPYRTDAAGELEILLITSKERRRWVIPKGNPIPFFLNYESAAREAFEEAGVEGRIATDADRQLPLREAPPPAGAAAGDRHRLSAAGHPRRPRHWPERGERELRWFAPDEAAEAVEEPELKVIIMSLYRRQRGALSARVARRYGRQPILLGVPDAEIDSRDHAEGRPLLRHVRTPRPDPGRRRRRAWPKMFAGSGADRRPPARQIAGP